MGVLGLNYSLNKVKAQYPLIVIATDNLKEETFCSLRKNNIQYIIKPYKTFSTFSEYFTTINKLYVYTFWHEKICFLDADSFLIQNIDKYFELNTPIGYTYWNGHKNIFSGGLLFLTPEKQKFNQSLSLIEENPLIIDDEAIFEILESNWNYINKNVYYHSGEREKYFQNISSKEELYKIIDYISNLPIEQRYEKFDF